jgi:lysophospholipase L1-like esterase
MQQTVKSIEDFEHWRISSIPEMMDDFANLKRYADADRALGAAQDAERRVIFFGDSITDNWPIDQSFPDKGYINRGIGGQTTPQMLLRFRQDVINLGPSVVVLLAGTNDIAGNTGPMTIAQIEANIESMAELARAHGIQLILCSVTPVHDYTQRSIGMFATRPPEKVLELNRWIKSYCSEHKELSDDGLHPNKAGYAVMAPLAQAAINRALTAEQPR